MGLYKRETSPYWLYCFKLPGHPQVNGTTKVPVLMEGRISAANKKLAESIYIQKRNEFLKNGFLEKPQKIQIEKLVAEYLQIKFSDNPLKFKIHEQTLKGPLSYFKERFADEITTKEFEKYRSVRQSGTGFKKTVEKSTVNKEMALLNAAYNAGVNWGMVTRNPLKGIKRFSEKSNRRTRHLSEKEKEALLLTVASHSLLNRIVRFALRTGLRRGEILNLKKASVDFERGFITVEKSKGGSKRHIKIHPDLQNDFREMDPASEYVFSYEGERVKEDSLKNAFIRHVERAGIGDFHFHDLRHTFAADYLATGGTIKGLQEVLGHASILMTMVYAHLSKEFVNESIMVMKPLPVYCKVTVQDFDADAKIVKSVDNQISAVSSVG